MRLSLTADELALLDLALQDREYTLYLKAGNGPLVVKQLKECMALRIKLDALNTAKPPKHKTTKPKEKASRNSARGVTIGAPCHEH